MRVLVTGGAGFIGSHTVLCLLQAGHNVLVFDNYSNSSPEAVLRLRELAGEGCELDAREGDIRNDAELEGAFADFKPEAVIHFAGLKAVGESVAQPLRYFDHNVCGTVNLLKVMDRHDCRTIVFSSSATVYGASGTPPFREDAQTGTTNPYGRTKLQIEQILADTAAGPQTWKIAALRYFNPIGAHESGRIGEDPQGIPNNLVPFVAQVAVGKRSHVGVFGNDYPTPDGTGVRDYIHVMDLADGHLKALEKIQDGDGFYVWNLGTGVGSSVLEVIEAFRVASGKEIPFQITPRRPGDVAESYADPTRAREELGWQATRTLADMCRDHWAWQSQNPKGYES